MFTQHVVTCDEASKLGLTDTVHENCTVIFGRYDEPVELPEGRTVADWVAWVSHAPNVLPEDGSEPLTPLDWQDRVDPDFTGETTDWTDPKTPNAVEEMRVYDFATAEAEPK